MKVLIVGFGTQGQKRKKLLGKFFFASVDPKNKKADYKNIRDAPLDKFKSVFICVPDQSKYKIIKYFLSKKKHILVEKPLIFKSNKKIKELEKFARKLNLVLYTAYNHRFEPHFINIKRIISSGVIGTIFYCYLFYGNGTARLVRNSPWRDKGHGVLYDLGSHLIDTINFWFKKKIKFTKSKSFKHENRSPDHSIINASSGKLKINLEMSLCMWKNTLRCDIIGTKGSLHLNSLCKWGPSVLKLRKRVFPSGKPIEKKFIIKKKDPTWKLEHNYFFKLIKSKKISNLSNDIYINNIFKVIR